MRVPRPLRKGDTIGVCAPSSGVNPEVYDQMDQGARNLEGLGYKVLETASVRHNERCVSGPASVRAAEFMELWENPAVAAIVPPWGGEFLMEILPLLDQEKLLALEPKWVAGYSDLTTLLFPLTVKWDIACIHGSNFANMGFREIHSSDRALFTAMEQSGLVQETAPYWGRFRKFGDIQGEIYTLDQESRWENRTGGDCAFAGRMIGGCIDTIARLIGTPYAPVDAFLERYREDGFVWTIENCELTAPELYRTLWQMRESGWFRGCTGILFGRKYSCKGKQGFEFQDAVDQGLGCLDVPLIMGADVGHVPPLMQIVNGSLGQVTFREGKAVVKQSY